MAGDLLFFQTDSDCGRELHVVDTTDIVTPPDTAHRDRRPPHRNHLHLLDRWVGVAQRRRRAVSILLGRDDVYSDWLDVGVTSANHAWDETGTYDVRLPRPGPPPTRPRSFPAPPMTANSP